MRINLCIKHLDDFRNYKVTTEKAQNVLSFHPVGDVKSIVGNLIDHMDRYEGFDNPAYSNIECFRSLQDGIDIHAMAAVAVR